MVTALSRHFSVVPFSGVPTLRKTTAGGVQTKSPDPESYSKSLRLTAAELVQAHSGLAMTGH